LHSPGQAGPQTTHSGIGSHTADNLAITNGQVRCPVCDKDIKVGMGGLPNFWKQHNPGNSKACQLALEKKIKKEATLKSQSYLQLYFTEHSKVLVPPTVPIPCRVVSDVIEPSSSVANIAAPYSRPGTLFEHLLADLEKAINKLPDTDSNPVNIEGFRHLLPISMDHDDTWIFILDPHLDRFLGFGKSIESIVESLKGQKKVFTRWQAFYKIMTAGFESMVHLLRERYSD
jgi:hypothetical protein